MKEELVKSENEKSSLSGEVSSHVIKIQQLQQNQISLPMHSKNEADTESRANSPDQVRSA